VSLPVRYNMGGSEVEATLCVSFLLCFSLVFIVL
jgi:hypothetical protein